MKVLSKTFFLSSAASLALLSCGKEEVKGLTAQETVISVKDAVQNAKLSEAWEALPESYQQDITEITRSFAQNLDRDVYDKISGILGKVNKAFTEKKGLYAEVIYELSKDQANGPKSQVDVEKGLESLTSILTTILNSDLGSLESLQKIDFDKFASGPASDLLKKVQEISKGSTDQNVVNFKEALTSLKVDVVSESESQSKLKLSYVNPETKKTESTEINFSKIESKWLPTDMVQDWAKEVAQLKVDIDAMNGENFKKNAKPQITFFLSFADNLADQLVKANSKEEVFALIKNSPLGRQMMASPAASQLPAVETAPKEKALKL